MEGGEGSAGSVSGDSEPEGSEGCAWVDTVQPQLLLLLGSESSCCKLGFLECHHGDFQRQNPRELCLSTTGSRALSPLPFLQVLSLGKGIYSALYILRISECLTFAVSKLKRKG